MAEARKLAELWPRVHPWFMRRSRKSCVKLNMKFQDAMNKITKSVETVEKFFTSEDLLDGEGGFSEKRDPVWKGR